MASKILFPTDFSPASNAALRYAISLAKQADAVLLVAHVEPSLAAGVGTVPPPDGDMEENEAALVALLSHTSGADKPLAHEFRTMRGDPAAEIVRLAEREHVDLIVMAAAGRTGLRRVLMGSVAEAVVRLAPCPVLNLREPPAANSVLPHLKPGTEDLSKADRDESIDFQAPEQMLAQVEGSRALALLARAIEARATDVHIDPLGADEMEVRFRIDGRLEHHCRLHYELAHPLVTQLKVMADLDIAKPFQPKEGRLPLPDAMRDYEARITCIPVMGGESVALRLLNRQHLLRPLDGLGLAAEALLWIHEMLRLGEGVVLVTGPAGSGKTTTAYSMLHALDDSARNIVTIEDPPEYRIASFRQMAADPRHNVSMTSGLRTMLRMDPDVVLVGEIRDAETAEIAMRAASSGKYVFTTLHTRDVASTITALRDLHIDNRSLAGNLTGIISQRLVRRLCPSCRRQTPIDPTQTQWFTDEGLPPPATLSGAGGCDKCRNLGYHERVGVFEVALPNRAVREAIEQGAAEEELRDLLRTNGTRSLSADALTKVSEGVTTLDEARSMTWVPLPG
jgi:type II secretory ATPase GspE/PulE/Tfp pilus assembly ATPase PilB-like protein/nucleotide-binding universal stress UspA family protein